MPSSLDIVRKRRDRSQRSRQRAKGGWLRFGMGAGFIVSALIAILILGVTLTYASLTRDLPSIAQLPILLDPQAGLLLQPTRLYDRTGQHFLLALAPQDDQRTFISYDRIPTELVDATLALSDTGFWEHPGYVVEGWQEPEQHPTLAQKLVSDLLLWGEPPSIRRALRERILAAQVTRHYGRQQVLEWYLNSLDFGNYAYGIEAAAQLYLSKSAADLDLSESALLAAVGQAPALNPFDAPQAAEQRRLETLQIMLAMGMLPSPSTTLPPPPAIIDGRGEGGEGRATAFTNLVLSQLDERLGRDRVARGGLLIRTSLDYDLQLQVECALQNQVMRLGGNLTQIPAADGSPCEAAYFLVSLLPEQGPGSLAASALVLDPGSGQVLAAVGEVHDGQVSPYLSAHPAGSTLTPFIYLTGFTRGLSPASLGWDIPGSIENFDGNHHGPVSLREALVNDYLPPVASLMAQMGSENVRRTAASFGIDLSPDYTLLSGDITLLEAAQAYGVFAANGVMTGQALTENNFRPVSVLEVATIDHAIWLDWKQPERRLLVSAQLAYLMNHVLSDETARHLFLGDPGFLEIGRPAGVKFGQTANGQDAWVVGYTPQRVVTVWMGDGQAAVPVDAATGLWSALMQVASQGLPALGWDMPPGVTVMEVCDPSGLLVTSACPNVVREVFITGNEPTQADTLFQAFEVNRETGFLATVFTSPELIEERVYMLVPSEAQAWAEAAGIPAAPSSYDTIQVPLVDPDAHIASPPLFSEVKGTVEITGTAAGGDFASYRLEYGQGLNPQEWFQIGADVDAPVEDGLLAEWDTSGLSGLYALRLLVVRGDLRVERAVTLVSVVIP
jgi:membrane peptidoglycan carboxypeptidase